jgi:hypothetical protein
MRRGRRIVVALIMARISLVPTFAAAQSAQASVDLGVSSLSYADTLDATAASITPGFRVAGPMAFLEGAGTYSKLDQGLWTTQGVLNGTAFLGAGSRFLGELAASAAGASGQNVSSTAKLIGTARANFVGTGAALWIGGSVGDGWDALSWKTLQSGEAGAWARSGVASIGASVTPTFIRGGARYTDFQASAHTEARTLDLDAGAGARAWQKEIAGVDTTRNQVWGNAAASLWILPSVAVVAAAGTYPSDIVQAFPAGRYVSLSLRVGSRYPKAREASRDESLESIALVDDPPRAAGVTGFRAESESDETVLVRVSAPSAQTVEVSGDFTGWSPVGLSRDSGNWWSFCVLMGKGSHQLAVRVNGGEWVAPPGLVPLKDEFGGVSGLLVIP